MKKTFLNTMVKSLGVVGFSASALFMGGNEAGAAGPCQLFDATTGSAVTSGNTVSKGQYLLLPSDCDASTAYTFSGPVSILGFGAHTTIANAWTISNKAAITFTQALGTSATKFKFDASLLAGQSASVTLNINSDALPASPQSLDLTGSTMPGANKGTLSLFINKGTVPTAKGNVKLSGVTIEATDKSYVSAGKGVTLTFDTSVATINQKLSVGNSVSSGNTVITLK